jgi:hypothetical protein
LNYITQDSSCQCDIHPGKALTKRQVYILQQLAVLHEARLIVDRRRGWNTYYRVTRSGLFTLIDLAQVMVGTDADYG